MQINFGSRSVSCKIVYYGPGLSGKTTNIQQVHDQMPAGRKGDLTSIKTDGDRTLFFDFMALDLGTVAGMDTRFQMYTVPGQVYYNATRKLVLQGADGIVFVADSSPDHLQDNLDSWQNLQDNLAERKITLADLPVVIQWNKRDVPGALPVEEMNRGINTIGARTFEAVACRGEGVLDTLKCVCALVCRTINARALAPSVVKPAQTRVQVPVTAQPVDAGNMRFVSRRAPVAAAASVSEGGQVVAVAAVDDEPAAAREVPKPTPEVPASPVRRDEVPVPPKPKKKTWVQTASAPSRRYERPDWKPVLIAAGVVAAGTAAAAVLHMLGVW